MARGDRMGERIWQTPGSGKSKRKAIEGWLSLEGRAMDSYMQASDEMIGRHQNREKAAGIKSRALKSRALESRQPAAPEMPPLDPNVQFIM
jgi:hypothetical protein